MGITTFLTCVSIFLTILSGGLGTFLVRYGTRLTLLETEMQKLVELKVDVRLSSLEDAVKEIKQSLTPVSQLPGMSQKLDTIMSRLDSLLPRTEADLHFQLQDEKIENIKSQVITN